MFSKVKFCFAVVSCAISCVPGAYSSQDVNIINRQKVYGLEVGSTRLIYQLESKSASLRVKNNQPYPILVQSSVYKEDKKSEGPFIVTPPIQRLEADAQTRLRVILTENNMPNNKEALFWLCVKGVPPVNIDVGDDSPMEDSSTKFNVNILSSSCIKLITRPKSVKITTEEAGKRVEWRIQGNDVIAKNNTPVYINFSNIKFNGSDIFLRNNYIEPYSEIKFEVTKKRSQNDIEWAILDDYGVERKSQKKNI